MGRRIAWTEQAWRQYVDWQSKDRKTLRRVNQLVADTFRTPFTGLGRPEPLKWDMEGVWSRRIDARNRLVYAVTEDGLLILAVGGHYGDH